MRPNYLFAIRFIRIGAHIGYRLITLDISALCVSDWKMVTIRLEKPGRDGIPGVGLNELNFAAGQALAYPVALWICC